MPRGGKKNKGQQPQQQPAAAQKQEPQTPAATPVLEKTEDGTVQDDEELRLRLATAKERLSKIQEVIGGIGIRAEEEKIRGIELTKEKLSLIQDSVNIIKTAIIERSANETTDKIEKETDSDTVVGAAGGTGTNKKKKNKKVHNQNPPAGFVPIPVVAAKKVEEPKSNESHDDNEDSPEEDGHTLSKKKRNRNRKNKKQNATNEDGKDDEPEQKSATTVDKIVAPEMKAPATPEKIVESKESSVEPKNKKKNKNKKGQQKDDIKEDATETIKSDDLKKEEVLENVIKVDQPKTTDQKPEISDDETVKSAAPAQHQQNQKNKKKNKNDKKSETPEPIAKIDVKSEDKDKPTEKPNIFGNELAEKAKSTADFKDLSQAKVDEVDGSEKIWNILDEPNKENVATVENKNTAKVGEKETVTKGQQKQAQQKHSQQQQQQQQQKQQPANNKKNKNAKQNTSAEAEVVDKAQPDVAAKHEKPKVPEKSESTTVVEPEKKVEDLAAAKKIVEAQAKPPAVEAVKPVVVEEKKQEQPTLQSKIEDFKPVVDEVKSQKQAVAKTAENKPAAAEKTIQKDTEAAKSAEIKPVAVEEQTPKQPLPPKSEETNSAAVEAKTQKQTLPPKSEVTKPVGEAQSEKQPLPLKVEDTKTIAVEEKTIPQKIEEVKPEVVAEAAPAKPIQEQQNNKQKKGNQQKGTSPKPTIAQEVKIVDTPVAPPATPVSPAPPATPVSPSTPHILSMSEVLKAAPTPPKEDVKPMEIYKMVVPTKVESTEENKPLAVESAAPKEEKAKDNVKAADVKETAKPEVKEQQNKGGKAKTQTKQDGPKTKEDVKEPIKPLAVEPAVPKEEKPKEDVKPEVVKETAKPEVKEQQNKGGKAKTPTKQDGPKTKEDVIKEANKPLAVDHPAVPKEEKPKEDVKPEVVKETAKQEVKEQNKGGKAKTPTKQDPPKKEDVKDANKPEAATKPDNVQKEQPNKGGKAKTPTKQEPPKPKGKQEHQQKKSEPLKVESASTVQKEEPKKSLGEKLETPIAQVPVVTAEKTVEPPKTESLKVDPKPLSTAVPTQATTPAQQKAEKQKPAQASKEKPGSPKIDSSKQGKKEEPKETVAAAKVAEKPAQQAPSSPKQKSGQSTPAEKSCPGTPKSEPKNKQQQPAAKQESIPKSTDNNQKNKTPQPSPKSTAKNQKNEPKTPEPVKKDAPAEKLETPVPIDTASKEPASAAKEDLRVDQVSQDNKTNKKDEQKSKKDPKQQNKNKSKQKTPEVVTAPSQPPDIPMDMSLISSSMIDSQNLSGTSTNHEQSATSNEESNSLLSSDSKNVQRSDFVQSVDNSINVNNEAKSLQKTTEIVREKNVSPTTDKRNKNEANLKQTVEITESKTHELPERSAQEKNDAQCSAVQLVDILEAKMTSPTTKPGNVAGVVRKNPKLEKKQDQLKVQQQQRQRSKSPKENMAEKYVKSQQSGGVESSKDSLIKDLAALDINAQQSITTAAAVVDDVSKKLEDTTTNKNKIETGTKPKITNSSQSAVAVDDDAKLNKQTNAKPTIETNIETQNVSQQKQKTPDAKNQGAQNKKPAVPPKPEKLTPPQKQQQQQSSKKSSPTKSPAKTPPPQTKPTPAEPAAVTSTEKPEIPPKPIVVPTQPQQQQQPRRPAPSVPTEEVALPDDEEFIEYKFSPRQVFICTTCQVCKIPLQKFVHCKQCQMVSYCSEDHLQEDHSGHSGLCGAIQEVAKKRGGHIYNNARILNDDDFRSLRVHTLNICENFLKRHLQPFEREILLFPRLCCTGTCREWRQQLLTECHLCGQVSYCAASSGHLPEIHDKWCKAFELYQKLVIRQKNFGRIEPSLPSKIMLKPFLLPEKIDDVFRNLYKNYGSIKDECIYAQLTQLATAPLTAFYGSQKHQQQIGEIYTIHLVGAELQFEADTLDKWETFFLHLVPQLVELRIVFVGPELNSENLPLEILSRIRMCRTCRQHCRVVKFDFQCGQLYHNYVNSSVFSKPDLVCFFNPGLYRTTGFNGLDTWPDTIKAATSFDSPIVVTSYTEVESPKDLERIVKESSRELQIIQPPHINPFASQRPERNFISDEVAPMIFKNFYCFSVK